MRFTLTFDGDLPSTGNAKQPLRRTKLEAIWAIRHAISGQLDSLWEHHHLLVGRGDVETRATAYAVSQPILRHGHQFLAIVRSVLLLKCELDIQMLTNHAPVSLITRAGDLDNRIKTLVDALRVPRDQHELTGATIPPGLYPCLMEDDAVVTGFRLTTDRYLACPSQSLQHVRLHIGVTITPTEITSTNRAFSND